MPSLPSTLFLTSLLPSALASFPTRTVFQFPHNGTWVENLVVRPNSDILFTEFNPSVHGANLYSIHNPASKHPQTTLTANIASIDALLGITQVQLPYSKSEQGEVYFAVGYNASGLASPIAGTNVGYKITYPPACEDDKAKPKIEKYASFPHAGFLNGVTTVPHLTNVVLLADSYTGSVGRFDVHTKAFDASAFKYPEMNPVSGSALPLGINGIIVKDGYLYWTNLDTIAIYRVAITPDGYPAKGSKVQLVSDLSSLAHALDDLTFTPGGDILACSNLDNTLIQVNVKTGKAKVVAGAVTSTALAGDTAVDFGKGWEDKHVAYVSISGGIADPINGTVSVGGGIVAVDTLARN